MAKAMDVADYIITKAKKLSTPVSNLQLQKIMYYLNVIHLVENGVDQPLIDDARFQRWPFGPVISSVYHEYSNNGGMDIEKPQDHGTLAWDDKEEDFKFFSKKFDASDFHVKHRDDEKFIDTYIKELLKYPAYKLVGYSHMEDQWKEKDYNESYDDYLTYDYYKNDSWLQSIIDNSKIN
ncbi:DUF4065 domain-containing protein [Bombilactobacillus folatiphilus]|uniref:DUF4065 domain-containing protein n=1 Tax=Bombilactobacillus folatiphilus TaxID=2923362 RepID=A0ABY4P8Q5_9LACO|nr:type II toxin-antitoxin system antitoxin SocA domain-containing protein [Bombilactobacillus folatiphilus]UQS81990.1 DUF4065 domain-containing protein [Bombilactobacillus folatiphilus]